jgi:hypothetical protein
MISISVIHAPCRSGFDMIAGEPAKKNEEGKWQSKSPKTTWI